MIPIHQAQFLGSPRPAILKRLFDIFHKEPFTARIAPVWPGSPRCVVLFFPEQPAPPGTINAWNATDGLWQAPEKYLRRCTIPEPRDAGYVQQAVLAYYREQPPGERLFVWHDTPTMQRERHRNWRLE